MTLYEKNITEDGWVGAYKIINSEKTVENMFLSNRIIFLSSINEFVIETSFFFFVYSVLNIDDKKNPIAELLSIIAPNISVKDNSEDHFVWTNQRPSKRLILFKIKNQRTKIKIQCWKVHLNVFGMKYLNKI